MVPPSRGGNWCRQRPFATSRMRRAGKGVAISPDKPAAQQRFDDKFSLGFDLLADTDHAVAEAFGVWQEKALYGKKYMGIVRSAFLIDAQGTIEQAWYKISPADTPKKLLEALGR